MHNHEFAEWLFGYLSLSEASDFKPRQLWIIKNHLNLVQAVDGELDTNNAWLDNQIVQLAKDNVIQSPPPSLSQEIRARYGPPQ